MYTVIVMYRSLRCLLTNYLAKGWVPPQMQNVHATVATQDKNLQTPLLKPINIENNNNKNLIFYRFFTTA